LVDDVRNFLFHPPIPSSPTAMLDLAALNIQRGRDHGLPAYNVLRLAYGLSAKASVADITTDATMSARLVATYSSIDDVDPWTGGICEPHLPGAQVGELFHAILLDQFVRLRSGDRFWFENDPSLPASLKAELRSTKLSDIIKRNLQQTDAALVPADVFHLAS